MCNLENPPASWPYLKDIETVLCVKGIAESRFGREYARDPRFVGDLHKGRELREGSRYALWTYLHEMYGDVLKCNRS